MASRLKACTLHVAFLSLVCLTPPSFAQAPASPPAFESSSLQKIDSKKMQELRNKALEAQMKAQAAQVEAAKKASTAKAGKTKPKTTKKADKKTGSTKTPAAPGVPTAIVRSEKYEGTPDPKELELKPDEQGRVRFNFQGQPWLAVLQWLADTSKYTLQWNKLPGDYLNLTTQRSYSLDEARDIVNQHLLARGYTMILDGETLHIYEVKELDNATVPRVTVDDLGERQPHEFVRCSFKLEWMTAGDAVTEFKPFISKHGKLHQMAGTNRLEALDMVRNLRAIQQLIEEEKSAQVEEGLVRQFPIEHRRAKDVMQLVQRLMGINPDNPAQPMSSAQLKQIQKAIQQAQKSAAGQVVRAPVQTILVLNQRENSILVQAEPDKMKQIEQAIKELDVPQKPEDTLIGNMTRMQIYRLNTYDPAPLVKLLEELGELDPQTKLEVDKEAKSIMAYASLADHMVIRQLIERVDGATRTFEVIQLQKLQADAVAGTIKLMMNVSEDNNRNSYDYGWGYSYRSRRSSGGEDKFKVDADVENNRLLLRANATEMAEIKNLLRKLGEDPDAGPLSRQELIKVYNLPKDASEADFLKQMQKVWPLKNRLEIDVQPGKPKPEKQTPAITSTKTATTSFNPTQHAPTESADGSDIREFFAGLDEDDRPTAAVREIEVTEATSAQPPEEPVGPEQQSDDPPVRITVRDGRLIVTSNDPYALNEANKLLELLMPRDAERAGGYKIFTLTHVSPGWMALQLEDVFEIEDDFNFWGPPIKDDSTSLSKKKELKFVTDIYTKTLMVKNATQAELDTIADLIKLWDVPEVDETREVRVTKAFPVKYSQANVIQDVLKEVYRDLLSGNDKALQQGDDKNKGGGGSAPTQFFSLSSATYLTDDPEEKVKFKGLLSVSSDVISNTIIVSSTQALVDVIGEQIELLDNAARPASNMRVIQVSPNIDVAKLQQRLDKLVGKQPQPQQKQPQQPGAQPGQPNPGSSRKSGGQPNFSPFSFGSPNRRRK